MSLRDQSYKLNYPLPMHNDAWPEMLPWNRMIWSACTSNVHDRKVMACQFMVPVR